MSGRYVRNRRLQLPAIFVVLFAGMGCGKSPETGKFTVTPQTLVSQRDSTDSVERTLTPVSDSENDATTVLSAGEDTEKTVVLTAKEAAVPRFPGNGCPDRITDDVELHVYLKSKDEKAVEKVRAMLEKDGFVVNFTDTENLPLIAVSGSPALFKRVFGVKLKLEMSALSARPGFRCALHVTSSRIPNRYKPQVSEIGPPDPQLY